MTTDTTMTTADQAQLSWRELLRQAFEQPGRLSQAYDVLSDYSIGNLLWAMAQAQQRGLPIGPIATYNQWRRLGRWVRTGETPIGLWVPIITRTVHQDEETGETTIKKLVRFDLRYCWFFLAQTYGPDHSEPPPVGGWDWRRACESLGVRKRQYEDMVGAMGAAPSGTTITIAPYAPHPISTIVHELAHILLGHLEWKDKTSRPIQEIQAESVAFLIGATVGLGDDTASQQRAYIQGWCLSEDIESIDSLTESEIRGIFSVAEQIRRAGMPQEGAQVGTDFAVAA